MVGSTLSHYEIIAEIGRGAMGVVYRARDTRLNREVALKVLPPELIADPERRRRFVQEAQAAANLAHPHIATVYEIGEAEGTSYITMELIEGGKLSDMLEGKPLPVRRALEIASEIVEGLTRAHERNVVHRDIKPANIMVTTEGHAKIIDFGLAKLVEPVSDDSIGQTTAGNTAPGMVFGTVAYMSPEQARGTALDHRTDIFSFGTLLFELVEGKRPFQASTQIETLNAILNAPVPALATTAADSALRSGIERVVHRCLEKEPEHRYQTARDLNSDLRRLKREGESGVTATVPAAGRRTWGPIAAVVGIAAAALVLWTIGRERDAGGAIRLTNPLQLTSAQGAELFPTWSPDGSRVAYERAGDIWVSQLGASPVNLTGDPSVLDSFPSWSPDGTQIAFASLDRERKGLGYFVVEALGGRPRLILTASGIYPSRLAWSADSRALAASTWDADGSARLELVNLASRESRMIAVPGHEVVRGDLSWSPDMKFIAYLDFSWPSPDVTQLWLTRLSDNKAIALSDGLSVVRTPTFASDGRSIYYVSNRGGSSDLWVQKLSTDGMPAGDPQRLTTGVGMSTAALSRDGSKLVYARGREVLANVWRIPIVLDRSASWADAEQLTFDEALIEFIDVTPDGRELFVSSDRRGNQDLWRLPVTGGEMQQVTSDPTPDWRPSVSPDGQHIAFYAYRSGNRDVWTMLLSGGPARQLTFDPASDIHPAWSPDGSHIAFGSNRNGQFSIWVVAAQGSEARPIATDPGDHLPTWSPDGRWLAFRRITPEGNRLFRLPAGGGSAEQLNRLSINGAPRWSKDGASIFYPLQETQIWAVTLDSRVERKVADFAGRPGTLGPLSLATDGTWLYFSWQTAEADLWTMDVVK